MKLSILPGSVVLKGKTKFSIHLNFTPRKELVHKIDDFTKKKDNCVVAVITL